MDWASDTALGVTRSAFNAVASGFASGLASSRVLVADSNVSPPAIAAAAMTALMNFNMYANTQVLVGTQHPSDYRRQRL